MTKNTLPHFTVGEQAFSRYGVPVTILEYPARGWKGGPYVKVQVANEYHDVCVWPPEWITRPGQSLPLFRGFE